MPKLPAQNATAFWALKIGGVFGAFGMFGRIEFFPQIEAFSAFWGPEISIFAAKYEPDMVAYVG